MIQVRYLIFNEGYLGTSGDQLGRVGLAQEGSDWPDCCAGLLPADGEVASLLALERLTEARRAARTTSDGAPVPLNRAVATAKVHGPAAGLALLVSLLDDERVTRGHRYHAVRAQPSSCAETRRLPRRPI